MPGGHCGRGTGRTNRTSGRNGSSVLYSASRGRDQGRSACPVRARCRAWFEATFEAPTPAQSEGWAAIAEGRHTLIHAPTGSGKTLAAFLWCLDRLVQDPRPAPTREQPGTVRVLYVSPLKALTYDVERNLRAPLAGIAHEAARLGDQPPSISVASRTGDTPADERRDLVRHPPDILVTTPESLYLLLTSQAREILRGVEHVIVDEVHAIAGTKRGAHLALSLERLERLRGTAATSEAGDERPRIQRIGLSATQRPLETIARYLGGVGEGREVSIVDAGTRKPLELQVVVPVEDMARLGEVLPMDEQPGGPVVGGELRTSIWPAIHPRILELIRQHRSTIVFTTAAGSRSGSPSASTSLPARSWSALTTAASPGSSASRSRRS